MMQSYTRFALSTISFGGCMTAELAGEMRLLRRGNRILSVGVDGVETFAGGFIAAGSVPDRLDVGR